MQLISFAWTTAALLAGRKTVTRRSYADDYCRRFRKGNLVAAWDKLPRNGGYHIATLRLTHDAVQESESLMPLSDYEGEGYAYYDELVRRGDRETAQRIHRAMQLRPGETLLDRFHRDRGIGEVVTVIRFELVSLTPAGEAMKEKGAR